MQVETFSTASKQKEGKLPFVSLNSIIIAYRSCISQDSLEKEHQYGKDIDTGR